MSLAEKAAACQLILKLVIADIRKADETEQAFNGQISLLNETIVTSDLEIQRLQSCTSELESSLSCSIQEQNSLTQLNGHLTDQKFELETKIQSLETIKEDLIAQQKILIKEKDALVVEKNVLMSENERLLDCQTLIQEKLDHQVKLHVDHIKLQNNISELSEQIIAASEALQTSEEARLAAESRSNEFDANIQALQRLLDVQKQVCDDAEIRCQQTEDMLLSEKRRMEGMLSLKAEFEAQILTLQKNLDRNEASAMESSRRHAVETEQLRCEMESRVSEELAVVNRLSTQVESLKDELSSMHRTSVEGDRVRDEQEEKIVSLQSDLEVKALKIEELSILSGHLQDGLQAENKRIAEINENNSLLGRELELVLGKMKISESALNDSNRLNLQLSDTIKLMQGKLDSIENELEKRSRDSVSKIEKAHTIEIDRLKNELEHVAKKLATVNAELDQHKAETETFKSENSALLHKLYHELERKKKDLNEAILAAATIEKEKEGLENLLARTEKALKESSTFNEESEVTIAGLKAALKQESTKLCEATAIRKQLEKHYLRQIEDLLSNRPVVSSQEDSKGHGRRALSVLAGENSLENTQLLSPSCTGDRKTPMKARLRERSRNAYASHLADVIGSPAAIGDGASHSEDMDCSVRLQGVTKAKMQR
uniref:Uncharacterized protein n=1 Tax=Cryptomonas curvata TaxID=233186 RepID=A0A7S0QI12_9CRYP